MDLCDWKSLCLLKEEDGMGFRNLNLFNIALLAKQGWRLLTTPNTLTARVLKAKYFPHSNFMELRVRESTFLCVAKHLGRQGSAADGLWLAGW